jgi:hypothetical protein
LPLFKSPLKETSAGEGVTLFGALMTSHLAVFQTIVNLKKPTVNLNKLIVGNLFFDWSTKQSFSLCVHHSVLSFAEDALGVTNIERVQQAARFVFWSVLNQVVSKGVLSHSVATNLNLLCG